jgi:hypothetical protein
VWFWRGFGEGRGGFLLIGFGGLGGGNGGAVIRFFYFFSLNPNLMNSNFNNLIKPFNAIFTNYFKV